MDSNYYKKVIAKRGFISGVLVQVGNKLPIKVSQRIAIAGNRIELGGWYRRFEKVEVFKNRLDLIKYGCTLVNVDSIYLEFGVAWGNLLTFVVEESSGFKEFHGFDSFEGLPHPHDSRIHEKSFDLFGKMPSFDDPRVIIHKGLFSETLTGNENFLKNSKFIVSDCDLYTSTNEILEKIVPNLLPGDLLYFDDLHIPNQERLAVEKLLSSGLKVQMIGRSFEGRSALFVVI